MSIVEQNKGLQKGEETEKMSEDQTESTIEANKSGNLPGWITAFYKRLANQISSPSPPKQRQDKEDVGNLKKSRNNK